MTDDADVGFFRNLSGLATEYVRQKRKSLASTTPQTEADSAGTNPTYSFSGQELTFEDLQDIKQIREGGGQVAQLMHSKALLNFGEGAEFTHDTEDGDPEVEVIDGTEMTLVDWLELQFPHLDLLVLDLGEDALWYPYAVGELLETRGGDFKEFLPAEPWTLLPETNKRGEIQRWHQQIKRDGQRVQNTMPADDLESIVLNKRSARDKVGISEVLRNDDEIRAFKQNEQAINQAIELHGFPQRHVKVGKEDGAPLRDNDLRRVRTIFDPRTTDANTAYFTGQDVDVETLEAHQFDYEAIHEMDMRNLTTALGLPLEAGNVGSDGLGSGKPAELRFSLLKLNIKANQRSFGTQFIEQVVRPAIRDYSPFSHTADVELRIDDPLEDIGEVADLINSVGDYMTNEEARQRLDLPAPDDDEIAESYRSPGDIEAAEEGDGGPDVGGLFGSDGITASRARTLQEDFEASLFELVATEEQEDFTTGDRLGVGVEFPNSGVYVDWNIAAWPEDERLDGPHVSEYATVEDARTVAQGEVRELSAGELPDRDLKDVSDIDTGDYPEAAVENARMALEAREDTGNPNDCGTRVGWERANQLDNGEDLSEETINRMAAFARHEDNKDQGEEGREDCGWLMWKAWGGDEGIAWAEDKAEEFDRARENSAGGSGPFDHRCLGEGVTDAELSHAPEWDRPLLEMYRGVSDPDTDPSRALVSFASSSTPEFVLERIREAIMGGAMFSEYDDIPSDRLMDLRQEFADTLGTDDFTLDSITDSLMDFEADLSRDEAERIARTESSAVLNSAREEGYKEKGESDGLFYWTGAEPGDSRQTEACEWLIEQTNPFHGGAPVPMDELRDMVAEAPEHDDDMEDTLARPGSWVVHPNERSTFSQAPPNWESL